MTQPDNKSNLHFYFAVCISDVRGHCRPGWRERADQQAQPQKRRTPALGVPGRRHRLHNRGWSHQVRPQGGIQGWNPPDEHPQRDRLRVRGSPVPGQFQRTPRVLRGQAEEEDTTRLQQVRSRLPGYAVLCRRHGVPVLRVRQDVCQETGQRYGGDRSDPGYGDRHGFVHRWGGETVESVLLRYQKESFGLVELGLVPV